MKVKGIVSLWLGCIDSDDALDELMEVKYNKDGDSFPSKFAEIFFISRYDDDYREADFYEKPKNSLEKVLEGFSYYKIITPKFKEFKIIQEVKDYNCVILLYDFEYDGKVKKSKQKSLYLEYIGSTKYE